MPAPVVYVVAAVVTVGAILAFKEVSILQGVVGVVGANSTLHSLCTTLICTTESPPG